LTSLPDETIQFRVFELGQPRSARSDNEVFMAAFFYNDFLIIAFSQFDKDTQRWVPVADISWHAATGYEAHTIRDLVHTFGTKQAAETCAVEGAKAWVDGHVKAGLGLAVP
jgi:hypothetical protein